MSRRDEIEGREVEEAIARMRDEISAPSSDELRALAKTAAAGDRPLPTPLLRLGRRWAVAWVALALLVGSALGFGVGTSTRESLFPASEFGAFVIAGDAVAAPATVSTRSCVTVGPFFNVHIVGNKGASFWAQPYVHPEVFSGIPLQKSLVAVWTFGTQDTHGPVLYGWIADGRSKFTSRCRARTVPAPSRRELGPTVRVQDGWATGGRFQCNHRGRVVIQTEELADRVRMAVWIEGTRELVAIAETSAGAAWARVSKRCIERNI